MIKTLGKKIVTGVVSLAMLAVPMLAPAVAHAATGPDLQNNLGCGATFTTDPSANCGNSTTQGAGKVQGVVTTIVNYVSIIVGIIAVIMLIFGGLKYITSGGDSGKAASARTAIISAIIGLVIVALAQIIVQFVLSKANPNNTGGSGSSSTPPGA
ncbi:MAG TPA: pilin [Candidatus Saccharimonadales bacterium]|nr:pilin [Candidatus Saccharimonadales bacterium]